MYVYMCIVSMCVVQYICAFMLSVCKSNREAKGTRVNDLESCQKLLCYSLCGIGSRVGQSETVLLEAEWLHYYTNVYFSQHFLIVFSF